MTATSERITATTLPLTYREIVRPRWRNFTQRQLSKAFARANELPFDDNSRYIFLSDVHRGDGGPTDDFVKNKELYLQVLDHYDHNGFTYVEVGDGDELWKNSSFQSIAKAHREVFDRLRRFRDQKRLHLLIGNHELRPGAEHSMHKGDLVAKEALILRHRRTGQRIHVIHGHQADFKTVRFPRFCRALVKHLWKNIQLLGFGRNHTGGKCKTVEDRIRNWAATERKIVICGHTHRPMSARYGDTPYFNSGSCIFPNALTGLELQGGRLTLVKWIARPWADPAHRIQRLCLALPMRLQALLP
jgi:UDP-2,3-diacylglucosamine pyrophosphatase LpxH